MSMGLIEYPHKILRKPAEPVENVDDPAIQSLIKRLVNACDLHNALGVAAPQVGESKSIFVYRNPNTKYIDTVINPVIVKKSGLVKSYKEGCLSLPKQFYDVKRYKNVTVEALNIAGEPITIVSKTKMQAKILQHEIDHLHGILLCDK